jgi:hypothetical protein
VDAIEQYSGRIGPTFSCLRQIGNKVGKKIYSRCLANASVLAQSLFLPKSAAAESCWHGKAFGFLSIITNLLFDEQSAMLTYRFFSSIDEQC